ncbi:MAG TPA: putative metal-binding motif-containing protein [Polyangiaceae bacterium]|nr:putative metal-binding motif-containing protein [Polyangiaceae bacterium]
MLKLQQLTLFGALSLVTSGAAAKRTGQNEPCKICHEGLDGPKIDVMFEPADAMPGQKVRINVTAKHATAVVGGVFVDPLGKGQLQVLPDTKTWLIMPNQGTHTEPHPYLGGQVQFAFDWVAPAEAGTTRFEVWSNAANNNLMQADDSPSHVTTFIAHGCAGIWYYPDADGDGFGDEAKRELSCMPVAGLMTQGGDCNDGSTAIHQGVAEVCNTVDDNCDGQTDEGFMVGRLWIDQDGDGFGALGGQMKMGCPPEPGFAPTAGDCDDKNPARSPVAVETQGNGIDDNCDSQIDEKPGASQGGSSGTGQGGSQAMDGSAAATAGETGGCSIGRDSASHLDALAALGALLLAGRRGRGRSERGR